MSAKEKRGRYVEILGMSSLEKSKKFTMAKILVGLFCPGSPWHVVGLGIYSE